MTIGYWLHETFISSATCGTQINLESSGRDFEVLADIIAVEHGVDIGEVDFLVGELTTFL